LAMFVIQQSLAGMGVLSFFSCRLLLRSGAAYPPAEIQDFRELQKRFKLPRELDLVFGLRETVNILSQGDDRHAKAWRSLDCFDQRFVTCRQRGDGVGMKQHLPHGSVDLAKARGVDRFLQFRGSSR
jgi:hypothetical protein